MVDRQVTHPKISPEQSSEPQQNSPAVGRSANFKWKCPNCGHPQIQLVDTSGPFDSLICRICLENIASCQISDAENYAWLNALGEVTAEPGFEETPRDAERSNACEVSPREFRPAGAVLGGTDASAHLFTAGPWKFEEDLDLVIPQSSFIPVCQTFDRYGTEFPNNKPNGHLIASAPDLYEALKAFVHWYDTDSSEFNRDTAYGMAVAALKKARGEQ